MKCKISITAATDIAAWVTRDAFMGNVDTADLARRDSEDVFDWYHPGWFWNDDNGELYFTPPAYEFRNGHLLGINGRHRTILLYRHLEVIPMLLVRPHMWPKDKLNEIIQQEIEEGEIVELPDLPTIEVLSASDVPGPSGTAKDVNIKIIF